MDAKQFDDLFRPRALRASRRGVLAGLTSGLLARLPLPPGGDMAEAKKKRENQEAGG